MVCKSQAQFTDYINEICARVRVEPVSFDRKTSFNNVVHRQTREKIEELEKLGVKIKKPLFKERCENCRHYRKELPNSGKCSFHRNTTMKNKTCDYWEETKNGKADR